MPLFVIVAVFASIFALTAAAQGMTDALAKRIKANPERFVEEAAMLIYGFGTPGGLDAAGVERYVALQRAGARASTQRRLLAADLDADGAVSAAEMAVAAGAASASQRGRMLRLQLRADADADGIASAVEIAAFSTADALERFDERNAQGVRALLGFDADADGLVTMAEVQQGVDRLGGAI